MPTRVPARPAARLALLLAALALGVADTRADLVRTFHAPNPLPGDRFGAALVAAANAVLVGAPGTPTAGLANAGAAYLFDAATGDLLATFQAPFPRAADAFGTSVALVGGTVVVGARTGGGAAHLFDREGNFLLTLQVAGAAGFGSAAAAVGEMVLVGADATPVGGVAGAGSAYLFFTSGSLFRVFLPPSAQRLAGFGGWVASLELLDRQMLLVGASGSEVSGLARAGAAYVFDAATTELRSTLRSPRPTARGRFGFRAVAVGSDVLVSAPGDVAGGTAGGAAYLFDATIGVLEQVFTPPIAHDGGEFGSALAALGRRVLIGARGVSLAGLPRAGKAYLFDAGGGLLATFQSPAPVADGRFGDSAATVGGDLLIGESGAFVGAGIAGGARDAGAVHRFSVPPPPSPSTGGSARSSKPVIPTFSSDAPPTFASVESRLDALGVLVESSRDGRVKARLLRLLHRTQALVRHAADSARPTRQRRALLRRALRTLARFGNRVESRAGRRLFPDAEQPGLFRLADPAARDLHLLLATLSS